MGPTLNTIYMNKPPWAIWTAPLNDIIILMIKINMKLVLMIVVLKCFEMLFK